jgi:AcrR family transcriptional regulator
MSARNDTDLRTAVLDATRQLLVREGYRDLSMRDVASAVGCSVSSIYLYFSGKDALIHTLMAEGFERWHIMVEEIAAREASPAERLEALCRAYIGFGLENPEYYEIMYMFHPDRMARYPKELYRRVRRTMDLTAELVLAYAPEAVQTSADARIAWTALWATLHGVVSTLLTDRLDHRIDRSRYIEGSIQFTLNGIRAFQPATLPTAPAT